MKSSNFLATIALSGIALFGGIASAAPVAHHQANHAKVQANEGEKITPIYVFTIPADKNDTPEVSLEKAGLKNIKKDTDDGDIFYRATSINNIHTNDFIYVSLLQGVDQTTIGDENSAVSAMIGDIAPFSATKTIGYIKDVSVVTDKHKNTKTSMTPGYMTTGIDGAISINEKGELGIRVHVSDGYLNEVKIDNTTIQMPNLFSSEHYFHGLVRHGDHNAIVFGPLVQYDADNKPKPVFLVILQEKNRSVDDGFMNHRP